MDTTMTWPRPQPEARWRELVLPKEHGSWSLAFEPLVFGLLIAPSPAGGFFAASVAAAFFTRRPLRIAVADAQPARRMAARRAMAGLAALSGLAFAAVLVVAGWTWLTWLTPAIGAGALFLYFDLRQAGRDEAAEIAGAAAYAWLPAVFAILAGETSLTAGAVAAVMIGRAVPTVLCLRAVLRAAKTGKRRDAPALIGAAIALAVAVDLARDGAAPFTAVVFLALLALRSIVLLVFPRPRLRGRTLGTIEAGIGVAFVLAVAGAWTH